MARGLYQMPGYQHTQVPALQRVSARILQAAFLVALSGLPAQAQGGLEFARQLYNQGRYDQAITAASRLRPTTVADAANPVSYTHLRAHETGRNLVCRLLLEK